MADNAEWETRRKLSSNFQQLKQELLTGSIWKITSNHYLMAIDFRKDGAYYEKVKPHATLVVWVMWSLEKVSAGGERSE